MKSYLYLLVVIFFVVQCESDGTALYSETQVFTDNPKGNERAIGTLADPHNFDTNDQVETYKAYAEAPFDSYYSDVGEPNDPLGETFIPGNIYHAQDT